MDNKFTERENYILRNSVNTGWFLEAIDQNNPLHPEEGAAHTESYELNGQNILVPRVRIKNGKAVLNKENALDEALEKGDYIVVPEGEDPDQYSKDLSKLIGKFRGFNEGGMADKTVQDVYEEDPLALARAYGVEPVDLDETVESFKDVGQFALESLPGVGTAFTVAEIEDELKKEEPNYVKIGMLVGTEAIGLIPGLGTAAKNMIRKGADMARQTDEVMDVASNIPKVSRTSNVDKEKALAMIESQELRNAWVSNKRKELGISDTDKDYSSRDLVSKQEVKRRQTRKFPEQIKALEEDRMSGPEYRRYIRENQPATKFTKEDVEGMLTSFEDMVGGLDALGQNKASKGIIGLTEDVEVGSEVAARLDIPAYNKRDIWVAQITGAGKNMYGRTAVLKDVKFYIEGKDPVRKNEKMRKVGKGEVDKQPFATMKGKWQGLSDDEAFEKALSLMDDPEWIQVGFNPERHSFFYDKDTMMPVFEAEEVIQVGPLVLAKKAKLGNKRIDPETGKESSYVPAERIKKIRELKIEDKPGKPTVFNKGGEVMNMQKQMSLFEYGGVADDGMKKDPVSGNDIPPGSLAKEVRDDIPAMLSEGEYVVPADVLRYYGVNFFENLRNKAKTGLQSMEQNGRIGGEPLTPQQIQQNMSGAPQAGAPAPMPVQANAGVLTMPDEYMQQAQQLGGSSFDPSDWATVGGSVFDKASTQGDSITRTETYVNAETGDRRIVQFVSSAGSTKIVPASDEQYTKPPYYVQGSSALKKAQKEQQPTGGDDGGPTPSPTTPTSGNEFEQWGQDVDWTDPLAYAKTLEVSKMEKLGGIGTALAGAALGPAGMLGAGLAQTGMGLQKISDLRAAAIIARAQGMEDQAKQIDDAVKDYISQSNEAVKFLKDIVADGNKKAETTMNRLGLLFDKDKKGNFIFKDTETNKKRTALLTGDDDDPPLFALAEAAKEADKDVDTQVTLDDSGNVSEVTTTGGTEEQQQTMQDYVTSAAAGNKGGLMTKAKKKK